MPMAKLTRWWWVGGSLVIACAGAYSAQRVADPRRSSQLTKGPPATPVASAHVPDSEAGAGRLALTDYQAFLKEQGELDYAELAKRLSLSAPAGRPLGFDPTQVRYYADIERALKLEEAERQAFREHGFVSVDHQQRYGMASAYFAIYTRDLPVLVTTDSILHALHRAFDTTLEDLELGYFSYVIDATLSRATDGLEALAKDSALRTSAEDVDLYFTVARNLLAGGPGTPGALAVEPRLVPSTAVSHVLTKIASLTLEDPYKVPCTKLYGGERCVDWSQFRPRGHYTHSDRLRQYFRTMMWLGRIDLGFTLRAPDPASRLKPQVEREQRDAALVAFLLQQSGELDHLAAVSRTVDFMVGQSDNVTLVNLRDALSEAGITRAAELADRAALDRFDAALDTTGVRTQQIRGQILDANRSSQKRTDLPLTFQVFGQRFVIDSFALSNVVYDSIVYKSEKQERMLPSGLDVMAALGNDTAVALLRPALDRYHYASNLLATRRVIDEMQPDDWNASAYNQWLAALRTLDDAPPGTAHLPAVMRREPWKAKQLRTALASWAELRHDTILYAKPSYTASIACEYPTGFVEPYPAFFAQVGKLTETLAGRLERADLPASSSSAAASALAQLDRYVAFFRRFSSTMGRLEALAAKELASQPFTADELAFVKKTFDMRGGGSGPPRYDGWYPKLFNDKPSEQKPTVADVHTDPSSGNVLEVGVGDAQFLIVAIDNGNDRAAYVGPAFSYYEFTSPTRLTDEEWSAKLDAGTLPAPPAFTVTFAPPGTKRVLDVPPPRPPEKADKAQ